jgi:ferrous iron transport protein A
MILNKETKHGIISHTTFDPSFSHKASALGIHPGKKLDVIKRSPFNGPIIIRIDNTDIIIRLQDAANIHLK